MGRTRQSGGRKSSTVETPKNERSRRSAVKKVSPTKTKELEKNQKLPEVRIIKRRSRRGIPILSIAEIEEEEDGVKTRRIQKIKSESGPKCTMCKSLEVEGDEELTACCRCGSSYHIQKCLKYPSEFAKTIRSYSFWQCARCVRCAKCDEFIADPSNIECWQCCQAWHGHCAPKGQRTTELFDGPWFCANCCRKNNILITSPKRLTNSKEKKPKPLSTDSDPPNLMLTDDDIEQLMDERNRKWDILAEEAGLSSPAKSLASPIKKNEKMKQLKKGKRVINVSLKKTEMSTFSEKQPSTSGITTNFDANLFKNVKKMTSNENHSEEEIKNENQWVFMGNGKVSKVLYPTAYPEKIRTSNYIYICKFCLNATYSPENYQIHWQNCQFNGPPGNEIYRDGNLSFFEVDGAQQTIYCRNLCLLAKMFISSKTLYHEVETFLFYILCEITDEGFVIVGYFSKEKNPSKNNNLSCLLTLPTAQRMGYGRLLIDMSYALSRLELKVGSPEHPLSDLGVLTYRGYWRSSILCYLRLIRNHHCVSIKEISMQTRIHPVDIVNQLLKDNLLTFKQGIYSIKTGKRAYKHSLSQIRRRSIDMSKLKWAPNKKDLNGLDPFRLNYYI